MNIVKQITGVLLTAVLFTACSKDKVDTPEPEEQELITTMRLVVTNSTGFNKTFNYKVDNGFTSSQIGNVEIDDIVLAANTDYNVEVQVLNESVAPPENITEEVKEESNDHLFFYESKPSQGAGSLVFSNGSKDADGQPFNQTIIFSTGDIGTGQLILALKHLPTNKSGQTQAEVGGETDAQAIYPVRIE